MIFAPIFIAFALLFAHLAEVAARRPSWLAALVAIVFAWAALAEAVTALFYLLGAFAGKNCGPLFKRPSGETVLWPRLLTWPYLWFESRIWKRYYARSHEPRFEEVAPGLLQGARPLEADWPALSRAGVTAVLDLVAEFPAAIALARNPRVAYVCLPVLDGSVPTRAELERGAAFINAARAAGRTVLVHCTFGHGRSSTFTAAALLASGEARDLPAALARLRTMKRKIWISIEQKRLLEKFAASLKRSRESR